MAAMTEENEDMVPRITVRDRADAETIKTGLLMVARTMQTDYRQKAIGADTDDQIAMTIEMNTRIEGVMALIRAVGDGTMASPATTKED
jgi:hypothetical protein